MIMGLSVSSAVAATYSWGPDASATFDDSAPSHADANNWYETGSTTRATAAPGASDSMVIDTSYAINDGVNRNTGNSNEYRYNVYSSQSVGAGQSLTTTGTSSVVDYLDVVVRDGGVLDIYGDLTLDGGAAFGERFIVTGDGTARIHSSASVTADFILPFGKTEYVITSLADTFNFTSVSNAHFELGGSIGFDLSGFSGGDLDGHTIEIFSGALPGTYDDANTYVTGSSAYAASVIQSGTGADQTLSVTFTSIPEPSSAGLLLLSSVGLIVRRSRKN